jgi:pyrroline-5-carboxylate reductase
MVSSAGSMEGNSVEDQGSSGADGQKTVAILGTGVMGSTLLSGLIRSGRDASKLVITGRNAVRAGELARTYGVRLMTNVDAAQVADTLVLVVKPQDMEGLLGEISGHVPRGALVVSLAAGITTGFLEERLPVGTAVVRVMPNTPALVDEGMAAVSPGLHCDEVHLSEAEELLRSCGKVLRVAEKHLDAVTAISGSGPAYIFYVVEAMIEAGVLLGMPRTTSTELVVQTLYGAATMLKETGLHPTVLREQVSSPGGTTMSALRELDDHKVRAAFVTAMEAAAQRSKQLASGNG